MLQLRRDTNVIIPPHTRDLYLLFLEINTPNLLGKKTKRKTKKQKPHPRSERERKANKERKHQKKATQKPPPNYKTLH